jgi:hypothetical protein
MERVLIVDGAVNLAACPHEPAAFIGIGFDGVPINFPQRHRISSVLARDDSLPRARGRRTVRPVVTGCTPFPRHVGKQRGRTLPLAMPARRRSSRLLTARQIRRF